MLAAGNRHGYTGCAAMTNVTTKTRQTSVPLKSHLIILVIPTSSRRSTVTMKTRQTSVTRKKRSTSSTGSSAVERLPGGGASSAGGGGVWRPTTTVDDGREAVRTATTSDGWRRYARPGIGNVRHEPRCFHLDSVPPHDDGFLTSQSQQLI